MKRTWLMKVCWFMIVFGLHGQNQGFPSSTALTSNNAYLCPALLIFIFCRKMWEELSGSIYSWILLCWPHFCMNTDLFVEEITFPHPQVNSIKVFDKSLLRFLYKLSFSLGISNVIFLAKGFLRIKFFKYSFFVLLLCSLSLFDYLLFSMVFPLD